MPDCGGVLVIDDDEAIRTALIEALGDEGIPVSVATNGAEALECLRSARVPPCLILLDIMMPVMDGRQFRSEQARDPALADIPVVLLTADAHVASKVTELATEGGLAKPIRLQRLIDEVQRFCQHG